MVNRCPSSLQARTTCAIPHSYRCAVRRLSVSVLGLAESLPDVLDVDDVVAPEHRGRAPRGDSHARSVPFRPVSVVSAGAGLERPHCRLTAVARRDPQAGAGYMQKQGPTACPSTSPTRRTLARTPPPRRPDWTGSHPTEVVGHAAFSSALWNWMDTAHGMPSRTWIRALTTPVPWWGITSPRSLRYPARSNAPFSLSITHPYQKPRTARRRSDLPFSSSPAPWGVQIHPLQFTTHI